jgi:tetratricopeptide (TPR) repeat protein
VVVLLGMGGCGKTQLVLDYCQQVEDDGRFHAIFWVDASSPTTVAQSYTVIVEAIAKTKVDPNDAEASIRTALRILSVWKNPWLLIFDNFDEPKAFGNKHIREYYPQRGRGFIIFTSRDAESKTLGPTIFISIMLEKEGLDLLFLSSGYRRDDDNIAEAKRIIQRLGYLALAIDQAGAYIRTRSIEFYAFVDHFNNRRDVVLKETPQLWEYRRRENEAEAEQSLSVATTWELSLGQIKGNAEECESKKHFLTLAAFFNNQNISEEMFQKFHESNTHPWMNAFVHEGAWDGYRFLDVIAELRNLSLIQNLGGGTWVTTFSFHPLIQDWMKLRLSSQDRQNYAIEAMLILSEYIGSQDSNRMTLQAKQAALYHLDTAVENGHAYLVQGIQLGESVLEVPAITFATFFMGQGRYEEAEQLYERVLKGWEEQLGPAHPDTLGTVQSLAVVYDYQGRYKEAEQLYERVLKGWEEQLGPAHPDTLGTVQNLAIVYGYQGRYKEAEQLYERVLKGWGEQLGPAHPDTLRTVQNLAIIYGYQGRYKEAEQLYERVLKGWGEQLGPAHPNTLRTVQNLAIVYRYQGRYKEAEQLYERALKGSEEQLGPVHPNTLGTVQNLATVYRYQGRYKEAEQLYERALKGSEEQLGPVHPDTLGTVQNLAIVYRYQGRYKEAEQLYERALKGREEQLGPAHPDTLGTVQNLAIVYHYQGRYKEAEQLYERALKGKEEQLGPAHPGTLRTVQNLAICRRLMQPPSPPTIL